MAVRSAVIIGGGITGALTARELSLAGWKVTVLEAKHVGAGSSSRTAAGIRQQFSTPATVRGMRYSVGWYRRFTEEIEDGTCPIIQNGYLFLHEAPARWASALAVVAVQRAAGLAEVEALEGEELWRRFPWVDRERCIGGTFCPTDGFLLPHLVYNEGMRRARALGAEVVQSAPVLSAERTGDRVTAVHTPKGVFEADLFLDCTNAWSRRTGRILGAVELPVDPLKRYLWFLARGGSMTAETLGTLPLTIAPTGVYCRPENAESLLIGKLHATPPEVAFTYEDQDRVEPEFAPTSGTDAVPWALWAELAEFLPAVGEFDGFSAVTSGFYGTTPDHNPFLDYDPEIRNLIRLVGFSGHGVMFGPFTAWVARHLAEAGKRIATVPLDGHDLDVSNFHIGRTYDSHEQLVI
ncbi:MAG: FAD-binding oxidoreductase [Deltaproteobacteria bacterium]|nr:FAD-binding oxidoreductase [Deltaproteobacteria bacterium]